MLKAVLFFVGGVILIFLILGIIAQQHFSMKFPSFSHSDGSVRSEQTTPRSSETPDVDELPQEIVVASGEVFEATEVSQDLDQAAVETEVDESTEKELSLHEIIQMNVQLLAKIESAAAFQHHRLVTFAIHDFGDTTIHSLVCSGTRCSGLFRTNTLEHAQRLGDWITNKPNSLAFVKEGSQRVFVEDGVHFIHVVLQTDPTKGFPKE
ncbi:hypothetical protein [Aliidiomarina indica]|uniref:hypothetical protein n=1 Tax=Aliidiomarina indica TaxID=2749147 RepID=UPI00188F03BB|nr:hypothetical protein [Aliidiomarina indica]